MKNFLQKFIRILVTVLCLLVMVELASYCIYAIKWHSQLATQWQNGNKVILKYYYPWKYNPFAEYSDWKETVFTKNSNKRPIAILGCSFVFGEMLKDNHKLSYKLSNISNRTVYQRGITATGLTYVYYQIKNKLINTTPTEPEYIIYLFIFDHINRMFETQVGFWSPFLNLRYEYKDGKIQEVEIKYPILHMFYFTRLIDEYCADKSFLREIRDYSLFKHILTDMMKVSKENYPNSKIVFLEYPQTEDEYSKLPADVVKFIEDSGYIYINADKLTGKKLGDNEHKIDGEWIHPNEKAWNAVAPALAKELNL